MAAAYDSMGWDSNPASSYAAAQTLISDILGRTTVVEENIYINGDTGLPSSPGFLRDIEEQLNSMKLTMEENIASLDRLVVQVYKYSKMPVQAQASTEMECKSLPKLMDEFNTKMGELGRAIQYFSSSEPPSPFRDIDLYLLIKSIAKDDWIHLMRVLNLTKAEIETCTSVFQNVKEQKYQMLQVWLSKTHDGVKNRKEELIYALEMIEYGSVANMFRNGCTRTAPA